MHHPPLWKSKLFVPGVVVVVGVLVGLTLLLRAAPTARATEMSPVDPAFVQQLIGDTDAGDYARLYGPDDPRPDGLARDVQPLNQVQRVTLPPVDVAQLRAEDLINEAAGQPLRFAAPIAVQIDPDTYGTWESGKDDRLVWRVRIASPGAVSLNLGFTRYFMPRGGRLYLYRPDQKIVIGAFTDRDNEVHGQLWTPIVRGDEVVIEVSLPAAERSNLQLRLTAVNYGYKNLNEPTSQSCNVDVVCPQGDGWRDDIRSVAVYAIDGTFNCTGSMVNNTAQDLKAYFLTANHCGVDSGNAATVVTYWNYENSTCRTPGSIESGNPGDGSLAQFMSGAIFRAAYAASDFTLIEMDDPVPADFHIYWAGWDRSGVDATSSTVIHQPNTEEKRISFSNMATQITSYNGTVVPGDSTHVRVVQYSLGSTEGGSSGSPLFDQNHHVIGQLHGGPASCSNTSSDYYGRVFLSWTGGGTGASRLSNWLDPASTGASNLNGRNATSFSLTVEPALQSICQPANAAFAISVTTNITSAAPVALTVNGVPGSLTSSFSVNPVTPTGVSLLTIGNTAAVTGSYNLSVVGTAVTDVVTVPVSLVIAGGVPGQTALLTPANHAQNQVVRPTYTWSPGAEAASYTLEVATDPAFSGIVYSATTTAISHTQTVDLSLLTHYYWRVRATNGCGPTTSATYDFTTQTGPGLCAPGTTANVVFSDTFESGTAGWTHSGTGDTWALSSVRTHSGANAFHADDPAVVSDQYLVTPIVTVPAGQDTPTLQFWNHQTLEDNTTTSCYDGGLIEISTTLTLAWTQITAGLQTDPYNGPISSSFSNPLAGKNAWCGDPQDWLNSIVDLTPYAGQSVQFRFRLGSDSSASREGWYIDDVRVQACQANLQTDLQILKTSTPALAVPGQLLTYTLVITNAGPLTATNASVIDVFPAGVLAPDWTCSALDGVCGALSGSGDISATVTLNPGGTATFVAGGLVDLSAGALLTNTASVTTPAGLIDLDLSNNSSTVTNAVAKVIFLPLILVQ